VAADRFSGRELDPSPLVEAAVAHPAQTVALETWLHTDGVPYDCRAEPPPPPPDPAAGPPRVYGGISGLGWTAATFLFVQEIIVALTDGTTRRLRRSVETDIEGKTVEALTQILGDRFTLLEEQQTSQLIGRDERSALQRKWSRTAAFGARDLRLTTTPWPKGQ
jgi:hypothetical protein